MNGGKMDLRVRYTKDVLRKSLLELMKERPIGRITIADICRKAEINRGTFYKHYGDPFDLLSHIQNELYGSILTAVERTISQDAKTSVLEELFAAIADNGDICRVLLSENGDKALLKKIVGIAHDKTVAEWKKVYGTGDAQRYHMIYTFIVNGSVGAIQDWIEGGLKKTPRQMAEFINLMANKGIEGELGKKSSPSEGRLLLRGKKDS